MGLSLASLDIILLYKILEHTNGLLEAMIWVMTSISSSNSSSVSPASMSGTKPELTLLCEAFLEQLGTGTKTLCVDVEMPLD